MANRGKQGGFTLAEVMVAMALVAVFLTGVFVMNSRVLYTLKSTKESVAARQALQERLEQVRSLTWAQLTDSSYLQNNVMNTATSNSGSLSSPSETLTVSEYPPPGSPPAPTKLTRQSVTVTVNSTDATLASKTMVRVDLSLTWLAVTQGGRQRTRAISTIVTR